MITVIAGVNGAGKSSIAGSYLRSRGGDYFNPDEVARELVHRNPALSQAEANGQAWQTGFELLQRAISRGESYAFETTLGGDTISDTLLDAAKAGNPLRIFYIGLSSPELHIQRVRERAARGGHDIPEEKIRERCKNSILNLMVLIPHCQSLRVIDNSAPLVKKRPSPVELFTLIDGRFHAPDPGQMPQWAKPLASAALRAAG